jgi:hypothetical protein
MGNGTDGTASIPPSHCVVSISRVWNPCTFDACVSSYASIPDLNPTLHQRRNPLFQANIGSTAARSVRVHQDRVEAADRVSMGREESIESAP